MVSSEHDESAYFFSPPVRPYVNPFSSPSRNLLINHRAESNQFCYMRSPLGKGVRKQHYFSARPSVHLVTMCERNIFSFRPSICSSRYLFLNHWTEFYQTCYMPSPRGKGVRKQHYFSVRPSSCPSRYLLLNHWAEFNQIYYMTLPRGKGVREQQYFSLLSA